MEKLLTFYTMDVLPSPAAITIAAVSTVCPQPSGIPVITRVKKYARGGGKESNVTHAQ